MFQFFSDRHIYTTQVFSVKTQFNLCTGSKQEVLRSQLTETLS
ncbi:hypothetical protein [Nostoc sp.]